MLKIGIAGAAGKMGEAIFRVLQNSQEFQVSSLLVHDEKAKQNLAALYPATSGSIYTEQELENFVEGIDLVIDFSSYTLSPKLANICVLKNTAMVCGTTGMNSAQLDKLAEYATMTRIFYSPNMSLGVNILNTLACAAIEKLGEGYDVEIVEHHHRDKKDVPSGTSLMLAENIAKSGGDNYKIVVGREATKNGEKRQHNQIYIHSIRGGSAVGEHSIIISGCHDTIMLQHNSNDRDIFAHGAAKAASFLLRQEATKLYSMVDLISEK